MYSFWSGEIQGLQEKAIEDFSKDPRFSRAVEDLLLVRKTRSDFRYFRKRGMLDGELLPLDRRLIRNILTGAGNSIRNKLARTLVSHKNNKFLWNPRAFSSERKGA